MQFFISIGMKRSEKANKLYELFLLIDDYIEFGYRKKHDVPDLTHLDAIKVPDAAKTVPAPPQQKSPPVRSESPPPEKPLSTIQNILPPKEQLKQGVVRRPALEPDVEPITYKQKSVPISDKIKKRQIIELAEQIIGCRSCGLGGEQGKVPGMGNVDAKLFVVTTPPGPEEERAGRPLMGLTGEFFDKWMNAIDLKRDDLFITNLLKCPPGNNRLSKLHIEACFKYLDKQLDIVEPKVILALGQLCLSSLRQAFTDMRQHHGKVFYYKGIPVIATFHPLEALQNPALKKVVWSDLKIVKRAVFEGQL